MANKAFVSLAGVGIDGNGVPEAYGATIVINSTTGLVDNPYGAYAGAYTVSVPVSYASTVNSIQTAMQADISAAYGITVNSWIWVSDKGLL